MTPKLLFDSLPVAVPFTSKPAVRCRVRQMVVTYKTREDYRVFRGEAVKGPEHIAKMFMDSLKEEADEVFIALYLDGRHTVLHTAEIARGTPNQAVPHIRNILRAAIAGDDPAVSIAVIHNHPSGNTTPSREDKRFTQGLKEGCDALEIKLVDHIIIGADCFFSFAEAGAL